MMTNDTRALQTAVKLILALDAETAAGRDNPDVVRLTDETREQLRSALRASADADPLLADPLLGVRA